MNSSSNMQNIFHGIQLLVKLELSLKTISIIILLLKRAVVKEYAKKQNKKIHLHISLLDC